jgi:hypothetical protein
MFFKNKKAQGTIEYLVILGIIVIIGLVVIGLTSNMFNSGDIVQKNQKLKETIGTGGISTTESIITDSGDGAITLKNNSSETLTITKIATQNRELTYNNKKIPNGSQTTFSLDNLNLDCPCTNTQNVNCTFTIHYTTNTGLNKTAEITIKTNCQDTNLTNNNYEKPEYCPTYTGLGQHPDGNLIICDCNDLQNINLNLSAAYLVGQDINCYNTITWNSNLGFDPIDSFTGTFNGNNKTISEIYINRSDDEVGLFGIAASPKIYNLTLSNLSLRGRQRVGGLIGRVTSSATNISNILVQNSSLDAYGMDFYRGTAGSVAGKIPSCNWNLVSASNVILIDCDDCNTFCDDLVGDQEIVMG